MRFLVTGSCGFIGYHLCTKLLKQGHAITGIDCIKSNYNTAIKKERNRILSRHRLYDFKKIDLSSTVIPPQNYDAVIHLAAMAGVRDSIENPYTYICNNVISHEKLIDYVENNGIPKFIYASSSSVYGDAVGSVSESSPLNPLSPYAISKHENERSSELRLDTCKGIGLRFFTVYGTYGRPDMAIYKFCDSIRNKKCIDLYNMGNNKRDFTHVSDVVESIIRLIEYEPEHHDIFNIGNQSPVYTREILGMIEKSLKTSANSKLLERIPNEPIITFANTTKLESIINFKPNTNINDGIDEFCDWFSKYYKY